MGFGFMSDVQDKHNLDLLREMVNTRKPDESPEEILSSILRTQGLSMDNCRAYYKNSSKKAK